MKRILSLAFICACYLSTFGQDVRKKLITEDDGFKWYLLQKDIEKETIWSAEGINGMTIVPFEWECDMIRYEKSKLYSFFYVKQYKYVNKKLTSKTGVVTIDGKEIIPLTRNYKECILQNYSGIEFFDITRDSLIHKYKNGKQTKKLIEVNYEGICDISGKEIISPKYYNLVYSSDGFIWGENHDKKLNVFLDESGYISGKQFGKMLHKEDLSGFQWYEIQENGNHGVEDVNGHVIIPLSRGYSSVIYYPEYGGYFDCSHDGKMIICNLKGEVLSEDGIKWIQDKNNEMDAGITYDARNSSTTDNNKSSALRALFQQAYDLPMNETRKKAELFVKIINEDPYNREGLNALCYNNIGILYEYENNLKKAKEFYEKSLEIDPNNETALNNLKRVKQERRQERWAKAGAVFGAIGNSFGGTATGGMGYSPKASIGNEVLAANQKRYDLGGGNYDIHTNNNDGSLDVKSVRICFGCHGNGICQACNGLGGKTMAYSGTYYPCGMCAQTGRCNACKGQGAIITYSHTDSAGNSSAHTSTGYTATGGASGTLVTDPNGRTTAVGVSGGSNNSRSSNGSGTCSRCNGRKYESTSYSYAAASRSGWAQPYHHNGGTGCPYCSATTDHYHYPCSECRGFGHK